MKTSPKLRIYHFYDLLCSFRSQFLVKSSVKPSLKTTGENSMAFLSSSRGPKLNTPKSVNFDPNVKDTCSKSALAFNKLTQHRKGVSITDTSLNQEAVTTIDKSIDNHFTVFDIKFDCSKAASTLIGFTFEGTKGLDKKVIEYGKTGSNYLCPINVDDVLLSIDGNDVKEMSMKGMLGFLRTQAAKKIKYCTNALSTDENIPFKKKYLRLLFKRESITTNDSFQVLNTQTEPHETSSKVVEELDMRTDTQPKEKRRRDISLMKEDENVRANSTAKKAKYSKKIYEEQPEEAEFDATNISSDDEDAAEMHEQQLILIKRIKPKCKIFFNMHPAEVVSLNADEFSLQVKWSTGDISWIHLDPDAIVLQEDLVTTTRSTRH